MARRDQARARRGRSPRVPKGAASRSGSRRTPAPADGCDGELLGAAGASGAHEREQVAARIDAQRLGFRDAAGPEVAERLLVLADADQRGSSGGASARREWMTTRLIRLRRVTSHKRSCGRERNEAPRPSTTDDVLAGRDAVPGDRQARLDRVALADLDREHRRVAVALPPRQEPAAAVVGDAADLMPGPVRVLVVACRRSRRRARRRRSRRRPAPGRIAAAASRIDLRIVSNPSAPACGCRGLAGPQHVPRALQVGAVAVPAHAEVDVDDVPRLDRPVGRARVRPGGVGPGEYGGAVLRVPRRASGPACVSSPRRSCAANCFSVSPRAQLRRHRLEDARPVASHASRIRPLLRDGLPAAQRGDEPLGGLEPASVRRALEDRSSAPAIARA